MPPSRSFPGDFEWMVLLAVLRLGDGAHAVAILDELDERAGRTVSRGALYKTLGRMEGKGWVHWEVDEEDIPERGGLARRRFQVTAEGLEVVRTADEAFGRLRRGLEDVLGEMA